jgi:FlaA1/EpsC-like NDP-sugar epimerase
MTIPEACSLVLEAGCMGHGGEIYIFDMGQPVRIYDLATRMISLAGLRPNEDIKIEEIGLRPGEKLYEELLNDKENTVKTDNEKIMIAQVRKYDYIDVCNNIDNIIELAQSGNVHDMVKGMKQFVPEYKSMHSEYEDIDKELERDDKSSDNYYFNPTAPVGK